MNYFVFLLTGSVVAVLATVGGWSRRPHFSPAPVLREAASQGSPPPALVVSTLAGHPLPATYTNGPGATARFRRPDALAADRYGNLYLADAQAIRKITPTGVVTTLAGKPPAQQIAINGGTMALTASAGVADGRGPAARFSTVAATVVAPNGTIYFSSTLVKAMPFRARL